MAEQQNNANPFPELGPDMGHDYDGIRELDNKLPNWWLATLIVTVIFGYGYWTYYHIFDHPYDERVRAQAGREASMAEYYDELDAAEAAARAAYAARGAPTDASLAALAADGATVQKGQAAFTQYCAACHKADGSGLIGPNLTDGFWIHGGQPTAVRATIANGIAAKGMPNWESPLGPVKVDELTAYVLTLKGKNLPGKAAEGKPEAEQAQATPPAPNQGT